MRPKNLLCLAALALSACGYSVSAASMQLAQQHCERHGGVSSVASYERGKHLEIICASGIRIEIKRHKEKP